MSNDLRMQVVLHAIDKLTRPLKAAQVESKALAGAIKNTKGRLKELQDAKGAIGAFDALKASVSGTSEKLAAAQQKLAAMQQQMHAMGPPTEKQTRALEVQQRVLARLETRQQKQTQKMAQTRAELYRMGISASNGASELQRITRETERHNRELAEQERKLKAVAERMRKINAIRAKAAKTKETAGKMASGGAVAIGAGVATGAALSVPVSAFTQSENAANQLAASMMLAGGTIAPEFEKINELALKLGDKLPGTTADFQNMMTMLRRQGIASQTILGGLGEATAYLGVQLRMAPESAAEFAAKLQDATQTSAGDMMKLMDSIQQGFYAGVDPENMLQGFSKIGSAMSIIRKNGLDAAKIFAPLLVMADQASMDGSAAGNAFRKIFQGTLDEKKIKKANDMLKGTGIRFDFSNGKGEFGGLEKMYSQLAQMGKLTTAKRVAVIKKMFGDDAEVSQALNLMITKGIAGYKETADKLSVQASLRERVDASLETLANKWDAATGSFTNAMASIGETVAPTLKAIADKLADLAVRLNDFIKAHPALVSNLVKGAAAFAAIAAAVGTLSLTLAAILGPLAIVRMSAAMLGLQFSSALGLIKVGISLVTTALARVAALALANPIGLIVTAIIGIGYAALYAWKNWETVGPMLSRVWDDMCKIANTGWEFIKRLLMDFSPQALIAKNFGAMIEAALGAISYMIAAVRKSFAGGWEQVLTDLYELPGKFIDLGKLMVDGILQGLSSKWSELKAMISSVGDMLPSWLGGSGASAKSTAVTDAAKNTPAFAGMFDSGGNIASGQFGVVGENGPELVSGPISVTSRKRTASLAAAAAGMIASASLPTTAAPLHPYSLPAKNQQSAASSTTREPQVISVQTHAPITIHAQVGQSAQDIAAEVARQLDARERRAIARARSSFKDHDGGDL